MAPFFCFGLVPNLRRPKVWNFKGFLRQPRHQSLGSWWFHRGSGLNLRDFASSPLFHQFPA
ncbi:hypothetical protein COLO4_07625 [Corchorus olitorius]|uniref:Uncharacterized protein n=1 Tax=Corchorus olitorius TaxID=93759 RepID=A0A1R3KJ47_9ROSI|nr:hypothetical protein COLO4_07625 [Corchorus olitorius]